MIIDLEEQAKLRLGSFELEFNLDHEVEAIEVTNDNKILLVHGFSVSVVENSIIVGTLAHYYKVWAATATKKYIITTEGKSEFKRN